MSCGRFVGYTALAVAGVWVCPRCRAINVASKRKCRICGKKENARQLRETMLSSIFPVAVSIYGLLKRGTPFFLGFLALIVVSGAFYNIVYNVSPVATVVVSFIYFLGFFGLYAFHSSPTCHTKQVQYALLFLGFLSVLTAWVTLELLFNKMYPDFRF